MIYQRHTRGYQCVLYHLSCSFHQLASWHYFLFALSNTCQQRFVKFFASNNCSLLVYCFLFILDTNNRTNNLYSIFIRVNFHIQQIISDSTRENQSQWMYAHFFHWKRFWSPFCIVRSRGNQRKSIGLIENNTGEI